MKDRPFFEKDIELSAIFAKCLQLRLFSFHIRMIRLKRVVLTCEPYLESAPERKPKPMSRNKILFFPANGRMHVSEKVTQRWKKYLFYISKHRPLRRIFMEKNVQHLNSDWRKNWKTFIGFFKFIVQLVCCKIFSLAITKIQPTKKLATLIVVFAWCFYYNFHHAPIAWFISNDNFDIYLFEFNLVNLISVLRVNELTFKLLIALLNFSFFESQILCFGYWSWKIKLILKETLSPNFQTLLSTWKTRACLTVL